MPARTALDGTPCWIDLTSSDTEVAKSFYTNVFGWQADTKRRPAVRRLRDLQQRRAAHRRARTPAGGKPLRQRVDHLHLLD